MLLLIPKQPIPFTADTLLGSFFKLPDGSVLVGGKQATTCGLNPYSGKVSYFLVSNCLTVSDIYQVIMVKLHLVVFNAVLIVLCIKTQNLYTCMYLYIWGHQFTPQPPKKENYSGANDFISMFIHFFRILCNISGVKAVYCRL